MMLVVCVVTTSGKSVVVVSPVSTVSVSMPIVTAAIPLRTLIDKTGTKTDSGSAVVSKTPVASALTVSPGVVSSMSTLVPVKSHKEV